MNVSPSDIEVMLHFNRSLGPHPRADAPAVKDAIERFTRAGLLLTADARAGVFDITARGRAWVQMLCATPFPTAAFVDPRSKEVVLVLAEFTEVAVREGASARGEGE